MTIPIEVIMGIIGLLGAAWGYVTWQNKQIVNAYFLSIPEQTRVLQAITRAIEKLDQRITTHERDEISHWEKACSILEAQQDIQRSTLDRLARLENGHPQDTKKP